VHGSSFDTPFSRFHFQSSLHPSPLRALRVTHAVVADRPVITQCCIEALYALGKPGQPIVNVAKTFERRRCNHREAIAPDECIKDVVGESSEDEVEMRRGPWSLGVWEFGSLGSGDSGFPPLDWMISSRRAGREQD
jgi:hypothetical protein